MTTHGRMLVRQADDHKEKIHLYAWHDGHFNEAIELLVNLPKTLFSFSKEAHFIWVMEKRRTHGPWFYGVSIGHHIEDEKSYNTRNELQKSWSNFLGLELHASSVSNWITFVNFNHWTVVPNLSWCSYPGNYPEIVIDVGRWGYTLRFPHWEDHCINDDDEKDKHEPPLKDIVEKANTFILDDACHIKIKGKRTVYVPFSAIMVDLLWQDIEKINDIKNGNNVDNKLKQLIDANKNKEHEEICFEDFSN